MICYKSTRGDKKLFTFSEVILKGIASDGGLFVPNRIPKLNLNNLKLLVGKSYRELCLFIMNLFETDFPQDLLQKMIAEAYSDNFDNPQIAPLIHLKDNQYILELWHGPTSAFKDMALQLMPHFFTEALKRDNERKKKKKEKQLHYLILVATSGDTGKAALEGYKNKEGTSIIVFYPFGGISKLQMLSMTTQEGSNVEVIGMNGNFDDAQRNVKDAFNDKKFNEILLKDYDAVLSSANSINWGRLLPQIVYYLSNYLELVKKKVIKIGDEIDIAVPTGNFGNIMAAFYAKEMGLPIRKLICASNENNVLTDCLRTGIYSIKKRKLTKTPSPSMDILIASNFERLLFEITKSSEKIIKWMGDLKEKGKLTVDKKTFDFFQKYFYADWVSNDECLKSIKRVYDETKYLIDPHTAVAQEVSKRYKRKYPDAVPVVICATAHWAKFPKDVYRALNGSKTDGDEFSIIKTIKGMNPKIQVPQNILDLKNKKILYKVKINATKIEVEKVISQYLSK